MNKILSLLLGSYCFLQTSICYAADKLELLPDLPNSLSQSAEASTISNSYNTLDTSTQSIGHEPNILSVIFSLIIVILLIYVTGIIYTKLNKFGLSAVKYQEKELSSLKPTILSTTLLGNNKSLHVIELGGKRMLIGASQSSVQLIKDLGNIDTNDYQKEEYTNIEIPNIKIPKIEIPFINFSKLATKIHKDTINSKFDESVNDDLVDTVEKQQNSDDIIGSLFEETGENVTNQETQQNPHKVNPEEYALYKKYIS